MKGAFVLSQSHGEYLKCVFSSLLDFTTKWENKWKKYVLLSYKMRVQRNIIESLDQVMDHKICFSCLLKETMLILLPFLRVRLINSFFQLYNLIICPVKPTFMIFNHISSLSVIQNVFKFDQRNRTSARLPSKQIMPD